MHNDSALLPKEQNFEFYLTQYLKQQPKRLSIQNIFKYLATLITGAMTIPMYVRPTLQLPIRGLQMVNTMIGTTVAAFFVAMNSAEALFTGEQVKRQLQHLLGEKFHSSDLNMAITLSVSALSFLPFSCVVLMYKGENEALWLTILNFTQTEIANAIIHTFPVNIFYRHILPLFIEKPSEFLRARKSSIEHLHLIIKRQNKTTNIEMLRTQMLTTLEHAKSILLHKSPTEIQQILNDQIPLAIFDYAKEYQATHPPSRWQSIAETSSWWFGMALVTLSIAGFDAVGYATIKSVFNNIIVIAAFTLPPVVMMSILCGYFGGEALKSTTQLLFSLAHKTFELPLAFKRYPKTSIAVLLFCLYISYYSPGVADATARTYYDGFFKIFFSTCARYGVPIFAMINLIKPFMLYIQRFDAAHDGLLAQISEKIQLMQTMLQYYNGVALCKELKAMPKSKQTIYLNGKTASDILQVKNPPSPFNFNHFFLKRRMTREHSSMSSSPMPNV